MDHAQKIADLAAKYQAIKKNFDLEKKQKELKTLEAQSQKPDFWQREPIIAQKVMKQIADLSFEIEAISSIEKRLSDLQSMISLDQKDQSLSEEITKELEKLDSQITELETKMFLS